MPDSQPKKSGKTPGKTDAKSASEPVLSLVIPAKDEAESIGALIKRSKVSLSRYSHNIIVVDDGSNDRTSDIADKNGTIVLRHERNRGKGSAMKTGAESATGDVLIFFDGDGAHDPKDIPRVILPIVEGKADFVIGSRALPESSVAVSPLERRLTNNLASFSISVIVSFILPLLTGFKCPVRWVRITDCTSGFRAITRQGWLKLNLVSQGFQIETEMIYEAVKNGLVITEVPISCRWDSKLSHLSIFRDGMKTLGLLAKKLISDIGGRKVSKVVCSKQSMQTG